LPIITVESKWHTYILQPLTSIAHLRFGGNMPPHGEFQQTANSEHARPRLGSNTLVSDTVTVVIGLRLGKVEAVRRLKEGVARTNGHLGAMIAMEQDTWQGNTLRLRLRALGQSAAASIEVLEEALHIEVSLPWLLMTAAKRLLPIYCARKRRCSWRRIERSRNGGARDLLRGLLVLCRPIASVARQSATGQLPQFTTGSFPANLRVARIRLSSVKGHNRSST
jgi:hypothetical protein